MEPNVFDTISQSLQQFSAWATSITVIVAALAAVFKPIRNGIKAIYTKLSDGKDKNKEILEKIGSVETTLSKKIDNVETTLTEKIQEVSDRNDDDTKDNIRWTILEFANSCRNGYEHTKDEYEHIFRLNDKYHKLLTKGEQNSFFDAEYEYIREYYMSLDNKKDNRTNLREVK